MKKIIVSLTILLFAFGLSACQKNPTTEYDSTSTDITVEQTTEIQQVQESEDSAQAVDSALESMDKVFENDETELDASFSLEELDQ